jgi:hypothetical protein
MQKSRKSLCKDSTPPYDKSSKKSRNRKNVPQNYKGYNMTTEKLKSFPLKS